LALFSRIWPFFKGHLALCMRKSLPTLIEEDPLSSSYGVNFASALCHSRYFHVVGGLPGDAMHDVLEGCLQYECKELLKYLKPLTT
jgi:hypothetical protein